MTLLIDFIVIAILIIGIWQFREPLRAKHGNLTAALALFLAFILVLYRHGIVDISTVVIALLVGAIAGIALARTVSMIQVPAMVAFQARSRWYCSFSGLPGRTFPDNPCAQPGKRNLWSTRSGDRLSDFQRQHDRQCQTRG